MGLVINKYNAFVYFISYKMYRITKLFKNKNNNDHVYLINFTSIII